MCLWLYVFVWDATCSLSNSALRNYSFLLDGLENLHTSFSVPWVMFRRRLSISCRWPVPGPIFGGINDNSRNSQGGPNSLEWRICKGFHGFEVVRNWFGRGCNISGFQVHTLKQGQLQVCMTHRRDVSISSYSCIIKAFGVWSITQKPGWDSVDMILTYVWLCLAW